MALPTPPPFAGAAGPVQTLYVQQPAPPVSPGLATVLSFLFPGLGQMYCGRILRGFAFIGAVLLTIPTIIGPLCVWVWNIFDAYSIAETTNLQAAQRTR